MRAGIEHVDALLLAPYTHIMHPVDHAHQRGGAIGHGAIDDLAIRAVLYREQRRDHAEGQHHPAPAEIADHVDRRRRFLTLASEMRECTGERDVIDIVPGGMGVGAGLSPAGHAAVDQLGIVAVQFIRAKAKALHDAGAEPLDNAVRAGAELAGEFDTLGGLEVDRDALAPAQPARPCR